ncbi:MAG: RCC1 domain-containing protein [Firmicutes bacterium]|nr:RCC1 domain-containing protein [Bacillota bacterium]
MDGYYSKNANNIEKPIKILEDAVLVTGGWFNHAALLRDGTVWTWGYNGAGNCGVANTYAVWGPAMVADGVVMVWTDLVLYGDYPPDKEDIRLAWTGKLKYDMDYEDIAAFDGVYLKSLNNTVIQKADGSYWVCGENVGTEEKVVPGGEAAYTIICTHEFYPCE